jgi:hypothetical protein
MISNYDSISQVVSYEDEEFTHLLTKCIPTILKNNTTRSYIFFTFCIPCSVTAAFLYKLEKIKAKDVDFCLSIPLVYRHLNCRPTYYYLTFLKMSHFYMFYLPMKKTLNEPEKEDYPSLS